MKEIPYQSPVYQFEIVRHTVREPGQIIQSPQDMRQHFGFMETYDREHILRVDLNNAHELLGYETVGIGSDNMAIVGAKEVFRGALLSGASSIILIHNHPSGQVQPSREDRHIAEKLQRLGADLEIPLLDFLILGRRGRYYSSAESQWPAPGTKAELPAQVADAHLD